MNANSGAGIENSLFGLKVECNDRLLSCHIGPLLHLWHVYPLMSFEYSEFSQYIICTSCRLVGRVLGLGSNIRNARSMQTSEELTNLDCNDTVSRHSNSRPVLCS